MAFSFHSHVASTALQQIGLPNCGKKINWYKFKKQVDDIKKGQPIWLSFFIRSRMGFLLIAFRLIRRIADTTAD